MLASNTFAATEWKGGTSELTIIGTSNVSDIDTNSYQKIVDPLDRLLSNYREGMGLSYTSATTITVATGEVTCSNSAGTVRKMRKNTSTTAVTFSDLDTGAEASNTTYYVYAVCDADATTATFKFSASATTPTGVTYYKRLGSFTNNSSSDIEAVTDDLDSTRIKIATGTATHGGTISLPSGWLNDECDFFVAPSTWTATSHAINYMTVSVTSARVVTCQVQDNNWVDGSSSSTSSCTANYIGVCHR